MFGLGSDTPSPPLPHRNEFKVNIRTLNLSLCADCIIFTKYSGAKSVTCHLSPVICHLSHVTCDLSCVTCHMSTVTRSPSDLTITLCSFTCYESPRWFGNAAPGGLQIERVKKNRKLMKKSRQNSALS